MLQKLIADAKAMEAEAEANRTTRGRFRWIRSGDLQETDRCVSCEMSLKLIQ